MLVHIFKLTNKQKSHKKELLNTMHFHIATGSSAALTSSLNSQLYKMSNVGSAMYQRQTKERVLSNFIKSNNGQDFVLVVFKKHTPFFKESFIADCQQGVG